MNLQVKYTTVSEITKMLTIENDELINIIKNMLTTVENLNNYWQGEDYVNFASNFKAYIDDLNITISELNYLFSFMKEAANKYSDNDKNWEITMKKIGADNEWVI